MREIFKRKFSKEVRQSPEFKEIRQKKIVKSLRNARDLTFITTIFLASTPEIASIIGGISVVDNTALQYLKHRWEMK